MDKKKIAIIGGGPAGLSTAFHLTQEPGWQDRYEITVYQLGWRLGGKGATGRDASKHWRIEEHGIHGFCRFYFNTWIMMKAVFDELGAERSKVPTPQIDKAFLPSSLSYSVSASDYRFIAELGSNTTMRGKPWANPENADLSWKAVLVGLYRLLKKRNNLRDDDTLDGKDLLLAFVSEPDFLRTPDENEDRVSLIEEQLTELRGSEIGESVDLIDEQLLQLEDLIQSIDDENSLYNPLSLIRKLLKQMQRAVHYLIGRHEPAAKGHHRGLASMDMMIAMFIGLIDCELLGNGGEDIDTIDHETVATWLSRHGATDYTLTSQAFMSVPNILFSAPESNSNRYPDLSAASWVNWVLRSGLGKGDYFYFMGAGTGESVIMPLYFVLRERGVKFEFFHKLEKINLSATDGDQTVDSLVFERQAITKMAEPYDPLVVVPGTDNCAWPNTPKWEALRCGEANRARCIDFEAWDGETPIGSEEITLQKTCNFDHVVLAVPPSMIPLIGLGELERWQRVHATMITTPTQAAQIWLKKSTVDLGWPVPSGHAQASRYASANFPNPLNGMVVFDDVIEYEGWGSPQPYGLIYLCSQLQPLKGYSKEQDLIRVRSNAAAAVRLWGNFLTDGRLPAARRHDHMTFDFGLLYDTEDRKGLERFEDQYIRANTEPTEAYVQAPSGSVSGRFFAWDTGISNLVPAGDWTYTGMNMGAFESAISGGKIAAFALTGKPDIADIPGFGFLHPEALKTARDAVTSGKVPMIRERQ